MDRTSPKQIIKDRTSWKVEVSVIKRTGCNLNGKLTVLTAIPSAPVLHLSWESLNFSRMVAGFKNCFGSP